MKGDLYHVVTTLDPPIFDLGCGMGSGFGELGGEELVVGLDADIDLLKKARQKYPRATLIYSNLDELPLVEHSVSCAFAIAVMEHIFHLERTVENFARFIATAGRLYVMIPTEGGVAVDLARLVTSRRNAAVVGLTSSEARDAQRMEHCNTLPAIENALKKHFRVEQSLAWPFRFGGSLINITKSYRLAPFAPHSETA